MWLVHSKLCISLILFWRVDFMSKKKILIIIIGAVICVASLSVALIMVRGKKEKSINLGKSSEETDEQSYWNPDRHGIA